MSEGITNGFEYGVIQLVISDLTSQPVSGAKIITNLFKDPVVDRLPGKSCKKLQKFDQYFKDVVNWVG